MTVSSYDGWEEIDRVCAICTAYPEAYEEIKSQYPVFVAGKKMFAGFGMEDGVPTIDFMVTDDQFERLVGSGRILRSPYAGGGFSWVSLVLREPIDWQELERLLVGSYRLIASKRMIESLDSKSDGFGGKSVPESRKQKK